MMGRRATRTNHQGQRRHPSHQQAVDMTALETFTNSFQATLDHGAPSRHGCYLRAAAVRCAVFAPAIPPSGHGCKRLGF